MLTPHFLSTLLRLLGRNRSDAKPADAELDARFREALVKGEITGDTVAVDEQGREVKNLKPSNIFDA